MGTNSNRSNEDWERLAKSLYEKPAGEHEPKDFSPENLATNSGKEEIYRMAKQIDLHLNLKKYDSHRALQKVYSRINKQTERSGSRIIFMRALKIAAVLLLAVLIGSSIYFIHEKNLQTVATAEVTVDDLGLSQIELADGTKVTLNRDSKINYPDEFGTDTREVSIVGEAFFEVAPNANKPFIIHAGEATIKVLGTSFSVNAYPENDKVEVIVETGKVKFSKLDNSPKTTNELILDPGEKGTYINTSKLLSKCMNDDPNFLAWKTHKLVFNKTSLKEVIKQLNKAYHVQIDTADPSLNKLLLNAHFEKESLDFILEVISTTHGLKIDKKGEHYLLKKEA